MTRQRHAGRGAPRSAMTRQRHAGRADRTDHAQACADGQWSRTDIDPTTATANGPL
jgi:hypothetical protein